MPFTLDSEKPNGTADLDTLTDELTSEIPEPQQHAIDQAQADAAANPGQDGAASETVELDALGVPWNPEIHATSATTGKGVRTAKGAWRKRKGLTGSASHLNKGSTSSAAKAEPDQAEVARATAEQQSRMAGAMVAQTMIYISAGIGGDAFQPRVVQIPGGNSYNEKDMLSQVWGDYFVAKGVVDIPPGIALLGGLSMYYLPRFREPEVRKRAGGFVRWMKDKAEWVYFKVKYRGKKPPPSETPKRANGDVNHARETPIEPSFHGI
jgi:hypothetical protein